MMYSTTATRDNQAKPSQTDCEINTLSRMDMMVPKQGVANEAKKMKEELARKRKKIQHLEKKVQNSKTEAKKRALDDIDKKAQAVAAQKKAKRVIVRSKRTMFVPVFARNSSLNLDCLLKL